MLFSYNNRKQTLIVLRKRAEFRWCYFVRKRKKKEPSQGTGGRTLIQVSKKYTCLITPILCKLSLEQGLLITEVVMISASWHIHLFNTIYRSHFCHLPSWGMEEMSPSRKVTGYAPDETCQIF